MAVCSSGIVGEIPADAYELSTASNSLFWLLVRSYEEFDSALLGLMLLLPESGCDGVFGAGTEGGSALGSSAVDGLDFGKPDIGVVVGFVNRLLINGFAGIVGLLSGAFAGDAGLTVMGLAATAGPGRTGGFCEAIPSAGEMFNGWLSNGGDAAVVVGGAAATTGAGAGGDDAGAGGDGPVGDGPVGGTPDLVAGLAGAPPGFTGTDDLG